MLSDLMKLSAWGLLCPLDQTPLAVEAEALTCPTCGRRYPNDEGVIRFSTTNDPFYEGAYDNQVKYLPRGKSFLHTLPLWLISNGYLWTVGKYVKPGSRVAELGCAGGVAWFGRRYVMAGVDVSHHGLAMAARKYDIALQAENVRSLPDGSLDAVISSYFWEHIPPASKPILLDDIRRVLKPGGRIVFLYDVATANPLISWLRRTGPELYQAHFIDADGHLGYQTVDDNDALFTAHGFEILRSHPMERSPLQSHSVYFKMRYWPGTARLLGRGLDFLGRPPFTYLYIALLRVIDETVGRALPRNWGRIAITVAVKR